MNKVILQPTGNSDAREHYYDTIDNRVPLSRIKLFMGREFDILEDLYPSGDCMVWGVTPGKRLGNKNKWERIATGDTTLFYHKKKFYASATTTFAIHNKDLAIDLWGYNDDGETWEFIYFLEELTELDIDIVDFNIAVGYSEKYIVQGDRKSVV